MKKSGIIVLQGVVVLIGIGVLALLLIEPRLEGVNANATSLYEIYFDDPFLAYIYTAFICFFIALYQVFTLLGYIGRGEIFSSRGVKALRIIRYCATVFVAFIVGAEAFIMIMARKTGEDAAGGVFMGLILIMISGIAAIAAGVFEKMLQKAVDLKSENDLTV